MIFEFFFIIYLYVKYMYLNPNNIENTCYYASVIVLLCYIDAYVFIFLLFHLFIIFWLFIYYLNIFHQTFLKKKKLIEKTKKQNF